MQHVAPITHAASDLKSVGIAVGVIGIAVSAFMAATVYGLSLYHAAYYAIR